MPVFNLRVPTKVSGVPSEILNPVKSWLGTKSEFESDVQDLAVQFNKNFEKYAEGCSEAVKKAAPQV